MADWSIDGVEGILTLNTTASLIQVIEKICKRFNCEIDDYVHSCIKHGIEADISDEFAIMSEISRETFTREISEMLS